MNSWLDVSMSPEDARHYNLETVKLPHDDIMDDPDKLAALSGPCVAVVPAKRPARSRHDEQRRNKSINALLKAQECLQTEVLYLLVNDRKSDLVKAKDALELVDIALDKLTVAEGGEQLGD